MHVVDADGDPVDCENNYWRRNIFGGHRQAQRLVDVGMGYWPRCERPSFPEEPEGAEWLENEETGERLPVNELADQAMAEHVAFLKATYSEEPGISVYKLCGTNDGWWVTKAECQSALKLWEEAGCPVVDDLGDWTYGDTIPFLRAAADHEGFRVW